MGFFGGHETTDDDEANERFLGGNQFSPVYQHIIGQTNPFAEENATTKRDMMQSETIVEHLLEQDGTHGKCCGVRRRLVCPKIGFFWPPRRSMNDDYRKVSNVLAFVVLALLAITIYACYFLLKNHERFHNDFFGLIKYVSGFAFLATLTIVLMALCCLSCWRSTTCFHPVALGATFEEFEQTEYDHIIGNDGMSIVSNGGIVYFSQVQPDTLINEEGCMDDTLIEDKDQDHVATTKEKTDYLRKAEMENEIQSKSNDITYRHYRRARRLEAMWRQAPFFICCLRTNDSDNFKDRLVESEYEYLT